MHAVYKQKLGSLNKGTVQNVYNKLPALPDPNNIKLKFS